MQLLVGFLLKNIAFEIYLMILCILYCAGLWISSTVKSLRISKATKRQGMNRAMVVSRFSFEMLDLKQVFIKSFFLQMGGQQYEDVEKTKVYCTVLPGIECFGERKFLKDGFPCLK